MKIVVIARTLNEERNIETFCHLYDWVDSVLVADGGSTDRTVELASKFPNVQIREFSERVYSMDGNLWRNPHGKHINFMSRWAEEESAEWVIFDDVDCFPTPQMRHGARKLLEDTPHQFAMVNRIYLYKKRHYFRQLTLPGGTDWKSSTSLYAWRANMGFYADESNPWSHTFIHKIPRKETMSFAPPMAIIHDYYPDDVVRKKKVEFYDRSGEQPGCKDPIRYGGKLFPVESWMTYDEEKP